MRSSCIALAAALSCLAAGTTLAAEPPFQAAPQSVLVYFGTHGVTPAQLGPGQTLPDKGIYAARFDEATGHLTPLGRVAEVERPTWLVAGPGNHVLYSVSETGNDGKSEASVLSFTVDPATGQLTLINSVGSGGGGATHLALDTKSQTLLVANYGTGQVSALPVMADGSLGAAASVQNDVGTGPSPRQQGPHAHGVAVDPSGRFVLVTDLGADRIFIYHLDPATHQLSPADPAYEATPAGSGPRHLVFSPNGKFAYADTELTAEVRVYGWNAASGRLTLVQTQSAVAKDYYGKKSGGEIVLSPDGRFLYVSNRGEDTVAVYAVNAKTGHITEVQRMPTQGDQPWHFTLDPTGKWFLVANESSSSVAVFKRSPVTGKLTPTPETIDLPRPVNITFVP